MSNDSKPTNPKDAIGSTKLPMNIVPASVIAYASLAWLEGMTKYGGVNWRSAGVRTTIYMGALQRHYAKYYDGGEWADPKTKVPHLASIIACAGIVLDAQLAGKLNDDRPLPQPGLPALIDQLSETVAHLKELHKSMDPHHFTVADAQAEPDWHGKQLSLGLDVTDYGIRRP
jgi:hypothetical protein